MLDQEICAMTSAERPCVPDGSCCPEAPKTLDTGWTLLPFQPTRWSRTVGGVTTVVTRDELHDWEKTQRTPDGKDNLRGVKLKERLDRLTAGRV